MLNEKNDTGTIWMMGFNVTVACNTSLIMVKTISGVLAEFTILRYHDVSKIIESQYTVEATIYLMLT